MGTMPLPWRQVRALIRHMLSLPFIRVLLASAILWLTAFAYCKFLFWRDPHSAFFKSDHVYDLGYSEYRKAEAQKFVQLANSTDRDGAPDSMKAGRDPLICAAFVTVKRDRMQYLDQSLGSMLEGLYSDERSALHLSVLFADTTASKHPNWKEPWVERLVDSAYTYKISDEELERIKEAETNRNFYVKGVFDYLYVLKDCMSNTEAEYIAIFEDDLIFADGWMARTLKALAELQIQGTASKPQAVASMKRWVYLRLFYTETSLKWQKTDFWYGHLPFTLLLASSVTAALLFLVRRKISHSKEFLDSYTIATLSLITVPAFIALIFMIGKYNLSPLKGVVKMNRYGCCTQAMVFPRSEVPPLIGYLEERKDGQTDSMIEEYADRDGLDRYALAPQVVQHIGLVSSRDNTAVNTQSNWAFWFETNRPEVLKERHAKNVKEIPWELFRDVKGQ
jgi:hypothetical protein